MLDQYPDILLNLLDAERWPMAEQAVEALSTDEFGPLARAAFHYRLGYRLYEFARRRDDALSQFPETVVQHLKDAAVRTVLFNMARQAQFRELQAECAEAGISCLLLKGLWLVEIAYGDLAARYSGDIDVLVKPEDMPGFTQLLRRQGFSLPPSVRDLREMAPARHELALVHPVSGMSLDVHWAMTDPAKEGPVDDAQFWRRSETCHLGAGVCQSLCLEDHLLLLCFHAAVHHRFMYVGPRAMLDVAQLVKCPPRPIDWADVVDRARALHWERGTWLMLELVREHAGARVPSFVMDAIRPADADDPHIKPAALEAMFLDQFQHQRFDTAIIELLGERKPWSRLALLLRGIFASPERIASHFHVKADRNQLIALFLRRCRYLFRRNVPMLLELMRGNPERINELRRSRILLAWLGSQDSGQCR